MLAEDELTTAAAVVANRRATYGDPGEHFARTAALVSVLFSGILRRPITAGEWGMVMILEKLSRQQGRRPAPNSDNAVDAAGYAACWAEIEG